MYPHDDSYFSVSCREVFLGHDDIQVQTLKLILRLFRERNMARNAEKMADIDGNLRTSRAIDR